MHSGEALLLSSACSHLTFVLTDLDCILCVLRRQNMKVRISTTGDTIVMKFLRPNTDTRLEGYILGYGGSMFSKQFIQLPEDGQPYETEFDAEPKYLIAVQPIPANEVKKQCTGKVELQKPLHLVIGSVTPTSVLLSWGTLLKTPYEGNVMNDCLEDGHYTVRYREKNRRWNYQTCPTSDTVIDKLKPNTVYEFGVQPNSKDGTGMWSRPVVHNIIQTKPQPHTMPQSKIQMQPQPHTTPQFIVQTKPQPHTTPRSKIQLQPQPHTTPQQKVPIQLQPHTTARTKLHAQPKPLSTAQPIFQTKPQLQIQTTVQPKLHTQPQQHLAVSQPTEHTHPHSLPQTKPKPQSHLQTTPHLESEPQPQPTPYTKHQGQPLTQEQHKTQTQPQRQDQPSSQTTPVPLKTHTQPQPHPQNKSPNSPHKQKQIKPKTPQQQPGVSTKPNSGIQPASKPSIISSHSKPSTQPKPKNQTKPQPLSQPIRQPKLHPSTQLKKLPKTSRFDIYENSSIFRPLPKSEVDSMGNPRFIAPHVIYKTDKPPEEPCSITSSLAYFPDEEGSDQNVTGPPRLPPSNLTVVTVEGCPSFVILDWQKTDNETREYEVVSTTTGPNGRETSVLTTNQTHTAVENLKPESSYEFTVTPRNELGTGPSSDPVTFSTESADPRVSEYVSGKDAIWTQFPFKSDAYSECNGKQFVKRTWYRKFVGIQLCNSLRYKIYLSDSLNGKFYNIGDQTGYGEDHCQFVDSFLDGRTGSHFLADQLPSRQGFYRALRQEPVSFGEIGGKSHATYVGWYECGTPIPGKW
uniref:ABI family, member 3 (NESH) binding protein a n=1 Tax=Oreochromis niloticus TaxID=8128 RepID=A0A669BET1_ORENI